MFPLFRSLDGGGGGVVDADGADEAGFRSCRRKGAEMRPQPPQPGRPICQAHPLARPDGTRSEPPTPAQHHTTKGNKPVLPVPAFRTRTKPPGKVPP